MSTKIWQAYRIPISKINEFTDIFHDGYTDAVMKFITAVVDRLPDKIIQDLTEEEQHTMPMIMTLGMPEVRTYEWYNEPSSKEQIRRAKFGWVMMKAIEQAESFSKQPFQIEGGFNFWVEGKYAYIIPIVNLNLSSFWAALKFPEWAKDFHYQNSTDKPERISDKEWDNRRETWNRLNGGDGKSDHNARRFYHSVIDMSKPSSDVITLTLMFKEKQWK